MPMKEYCVYRYTLIASNEVIYIGKTDASLKARIDAHEREEKFQPYRGAWVIDFVRLANRVETDVVERYLINYYKPVINEKDVEAGVPTVSITIPAWEKYEDYKEKRKLKSAVMSNKRKEAANDLSLLYAAMGHNSGEFFSNSLHPTGRLPLVNGHMQVTEKEVRVVDGYFAQTVVDTEGLESCFHRLEDGIYLSVYREEVGPSPFSEYWDFVSRLKKFKSDGFYESELSELLEISRVPERVVTSGYFDRLISSVYKSAGGYALEINPEGYDSLDDVEESIAKDECMFIKKDIGLLLE